MDTCISGILTATDAFKSYIIIRKTRDKNQLTDWKQSEKDLSMYNTDLSYQKLSLSNTYLPTYLPNYPNYKRKSLK